MKSGKLLKNPSDIAYPCQQADWAVFKSKKVINDYRI
jgi:hypothetical protein